MTKRQKKSSLHMFEQELFGNEFDIQDIFHIIATRYKCKYPIVDVLTNELIFDQDIRTHLLPHENLKHD